MTWGLSWGDSWGDSWALISSPDVSVVDSVAGVTDTLSISADVSENQLRAVVSE